MEEAPKKKRVKLDPKSYVSEGHGVQTIDLIKNPEIDDLDWDIPDVIKTKQLENEETPEKVQSSAQSAEPEAPEDPEAHIPSLGSKFIFNLIRKDIERHKTAYLHRLNIEQYLLPAIQHMQIFNELKLFKKYKENKETIIRKLIDETKEVCKILQQDNSEIINIVLDNEEYVTEKLTDAIIERLKIVNNEKNQKKIRELSMSFVNVFKSAPA